MESLRDYNSSLVRLSLLECWMFFLEYIFQESYFQWTFGVIEPGFFGVLDVDSEQAFLFTPRLHESYLVWMGELVFFVQ